MSGMGRAAAEQAQQAANRGFPKPSELTMPGEIPVVPAEHHNQHLSPAAAATVAVAAAAAAAAVVDTPTTDGHGNFLFWKREGAGCELSVELFAV